VSDVTRRLAAGATGAVVAVAAFVVLSLSAGAGAEPARASAPGDVSARVPGAAAPTATPADVLPGVGEDAPVPAGSRLDALLRPLLTQPALGGSVSMDVVDVLTGEHLTRLGETTPRTPASTLKLLTASAALTALDPETTLPTRAVRGAAPDDVVLVGGGDILLAAGKGDPGAVNGHAGLADLARATAASLADAGVRRVTVHVDDSLFTGPATSPRWRGTDVGAGFVAPVHPVAVDAGRTRSGKYAPRTGDPAQAAGDAFAEALRAAGVDVRGEVSRAAAPRGGDGDVLGEVRSAAVGDLVEYALTESDNTVSEVLGRLVALEAGQPASFAGAGPAIVSAVGSLGVPVGGAVLSDASGLGDGSRVAPVTLTAILATAASPDHPDLRPVLTGLPVAGVSGTLLDRFDLRDQRPAAGVVRAKTGSLSGVSSLAGTVVDADGRLLAFAVLADRVAATEPARRALDRLATTLAECGCG
jgi:D-alanyl-D-alanine carboxypeptidase/D-alanyl-D-alanine-endopeptidase (penicillin-binding protein 4)